MLRFTPTLRLATFWPALAALFVAAGLFAYQVPRLLERAAAEQLLDGLEVLSPLVADRLAEDPAGIHPWVRSLAAGRSLRITVVDAEGEVLADSARTEAQLVAMDNHGDRPEIRQARREGQGYAVRRSDTTGQEYVYAARTDRRPGGLYTLRFARPLKELRQLRGTLVGIVALAAVLALLAMAVTSLWLDRRLFSPLAGLIERAGRMADGRYERPLDIPRADELAALATHLNRLAERIGQQIAAIAAERDHLQAIVASMTEGVLVVDPSGRAELANPAFRRLFGIEGEVTGKLPLEITRRRTLARLVEETRERGEPGRAEIEIPGPRRRTASLASVALADPEGETGVVVVAWDTTEANRLTEMRRDFIANVSHELKTPLAAIRGYAETLRDGALDDPEAGARFVRRLLAQCRRLELLLDDLLTLSRLESVEIEAVREPVSLAAVVRRAVETATAAARERDIEIAVESDPVPTIQGDVQGLERMVTNLLDNAVKYNRTGGEVTVRLTVGDPAQERILLEIADTGPGIPPEALPRIFERFFRVERGRSRDEGGTGLGLAIVKHTAEAHGGRVEVESESGRGATFRVWLPVEPDQPRNRSGASWPPGSTA